MENGIYQENILSPHRCPSDLKKHSHYNDQEVFWWDISKYIYYLDPSVKRGISVRMLWRQKVAKKRRRTRWVRQGFFVIPFGPNGSCRKPRLTDGSRY